MNEMSNWLFIEVMGRGGPVMWGILAVSLGGLSIVIERCWMTRRARVFPPMLASQIEELVSEIKSVPTDSPLGRFVAAIVEAKNTSRSQAILEAEVSTAGAREIAALGRGLEVLSIFSTISPLLGLLGTVTGLLRAFSSIAAQRMMDPSVVAGGVAEALLTTIFGLLVGIPLFSAHRLLRAQVNRYTIDFETVALRVIRALGHRAPGRIQKVLIESPEQNSPAGNHPA